MNFNKVKQQLEGFLSPSLASKVQYRPNGYRYQSDKTIQCYMTVDKKEIFNTKEKIIQWYDSEQEAIHDLQQLVWVTDAEVEAVRKALGPEVPVDRLQVIAKDRKVKACAKEIIHAQNELFKSDFQKTALIYLSSAIEESLASKDILMNVFALVDKRLGNKRLLAMRQTMSVKHPVVRYFYHLRLEK